MGLTVCPAAVVAAPVEVVWGNLVQWERYSEWADVQVERSEPEGPATVGQTIYFGGKAFGRTLHFIFKVEEVNPERYQLGSHAFSHWDCKRHHILPAIPSMRPPAAPSMAETLSSHQAGGAGFSRDSARRQSLPA